MSSPWWPPFNEKALLDAASSGLLSEETHTLDLKELVKPGRPANIELARDLASFSLDGGTMVIGVRDPKRQPPVLVPHEIDDLPERVEQVALSRIDPPLYVECKPVLASGEDGRGYLVVVVPPSDRAPHQVEGVYYGRGDKTKRRLSDQEVSAYIRRRTDSERATLDLLDQVMSSDPFVGQAGSAANAHLFAIAEPDPGRPGMLLASAPDGHWGTWLHQLVLTPSPGEPEFGFKFAPDFHVATRSHRRHDGWAMSSLGDSEIVESSAIDIWLTEDGGVRVICGRATDYRRDRKVLIDELDVGLVLRMLRLASRVATEARYSGQWKVGVGISEITGSFSLLREESAYGAQLSTPYPGPSPYQAVATVPTSRLGSDPERSADELMGPLLRTMQIDTRREIEELLRKGPYGDSSD